eukprot:Skav217941  [mRNA]  locus=scaffold2100:31913:35830:- [translate_table: standard]
MQMPLVLVALSKEEQVREPKGAEVRPESCAVADGKEQFTWQQLQATSLVVASHVQREAEAVEVAAIFSRRDCLWLAATLALEMLQNKAILELLRPQLLLLGQDLPEELLELLARPGCRQLRLEKAQAPVVPAQRILPHSADAQGLLCFQLTGGTTGSSKCVEVRQHMALHELQAYPKAFPELSCEDRVLQHTPVLWAASAIGQINIAASCGATLCISQELDQALWTVALMLQRLVQWLVVNQFMVNSNGEFIVNHHG